jgi:hypothetical protein
MGRKLPNAGAVPENFPARTNQQLAALQAVGDDVNVATIAMRRGESRCAPRRSYARSNYWRWQRQADFGRDED